MTTILIAPDSYKGSLSAQEVVQTIASQWQQIRPTDNLLLYPMADGGEGTMEAVLMALGGEKRTAKVSDPLGRPITAHWGWLEESGTAVIEMAQASGLHCVGEHERDVHKASTYGTGELIKEALDAGAKTIFLTLGGSATNDCGIGMLQALGAEFKDAGGLSLSPGGLALAQLASVELAQLDPRIKDVHFIAACDVDNPLCGERGASAIFGPQKGATPQDVKVLDAALAHCASVCAQTLEKDMQNTPGAGAAGGTGYAALTFFDAQFRPGVALVAELTKLEEAMKSADLVITGEGKLDAQVMHGKAVMGITQLAARNNVPVVALVGSLGDGYQGLYEHGLTAAFSICNGPCTLEYATKHAQTLLADRTRDIARLFKD